jgi:hypothetical protein
MVPSGQVLQGQTEQVGGGPQALVVGRLGRQIGEQMAEPAVGEPQPAPLRRAAEQDLSHGQGDEFGVGQLGSTARPDPGAEQVINGDVQCHHEGVEVGAHEASQEVDVASATPILGTLASAVTTRHPQSNSESII